jgi:hypothetical protein
MTVGTLCVSRAGLGGPPCETAPLTSYQRGIGIAGSGVVSAADRLGVAKLGATAAIGAAGDGTWPERSAPQTPNAAANTLPLSAAVNIIVLAANTVGTFLSRFH